ncbi:reverse transcriptase domain-containing protein [Modicisalibacter zincidurans]|uniref:reverse transcriptase domain-containing protein n=1 Tax=Modicisalibacter zincidurans TaxID=1178777 RepID=UPI00068DB6B6|nr:reverse transcriptase domain-containing protein [Halomonas zincidurans]
MIEAHTRAWWRATLALCLGSFTVFVNLYAAQPLLPDLIQQALLQVLTPLFDPDFSESSYGYRPKRSARQAVSAMKAHVEEGRRWVVDLDLASFFDRVNHDLLMARIARRVRDKRVLRLIRRYLKAVYISANTLGGIGRVGHSARCWRISCWTTWIRNWSAAGIVSAATPTTCRSMSAVDGRESGSWPA